MSRRPGGSLASTAVVLIAIVIAAITALVVQGDRDQKVWDVKSTSFGVSVETKGGVKLQPIKPTYKLLIGTTRKKAEWQSANYAQFKTCQVGDIWNNTIRACDKSIPR